jgi:hypothetical protein
MPVHRMVCALRLAAAFLQLLQFVQLHGRSSLGVTCSVQKLAWGSWEGDDAGRRRVTLLHEGPAFGMVL